MAKFVEVMIPLAVSGVYTYSVPEEWQKDVAIGKRTIVSFGAKKLYTGLITAIKSKSDFKAVKPILEIIDDAPLLSALHLSFWSWMSEYYQCSLGEVMISALPSGIRFDSETLFSATLIENQNIKYLSENEKLIWEYLNKKSCTLKEIEILIANQKIYPLLHQMLQAGYISGEERIKNPAQKKTKRYYRLVENLTDAQVSSFLNQIEKKAIKQWEVFSEIIHLSDIHVLISEEEIKNKIKNAQPALKQLLEKKWIAVVEQEVSRLKINVPKSQEEVILTYPQQKAFESLEQQFFKQDTVLLQGVTGSGKTYVYIKIIEKMLAQKMQTLYLLPEIALTGQIIKKLQSYFGNKVGIYHSKFNTQERIEIWHRVHTEQYGVILGTRSSLFLPFKNLGLIIIDEEHDGSYKQHDPAPRYHARDAAIMLAQFMDAKVVLGSATPSLETYKNMKDGKYGWVQMKTRFLNAKLPQINIVNTQEALRKKQMNGSFSKTLFDKIQDKLLKSEQIILFQNRRGFAPYLKCNDCEHSPKCKNCDVSLTYHQYLKKIKCHLCGYSENTPSTCKQCSSSAIKMVGTGTEKIEEEIQLFFPHAKTDRLDLETARGKESHLRIIENFESQKTQILIGTQMVTKGLDFDHVSLVGIVNVDLLLQQPDFRAAEKTFQLIAQVSGRAGRKETEGEVILQSARPQHPIIQLAAQNDFEAFYELEMQHRKDFFYPPFSRMIKLTLKHKQPEALKQATDYFVKQFRLPAGIKMLGPTTPLISKIKNLYLKELTFKIPKNTMLINLCKQNIAEATKALQQHSLLRQTVMSIDVDTY